MSNGQTKKIDIRLPAEARKAVDEIAQERGVQAGKNVYPSDIVREAVAEYLAARGRDISLAVDRGGNRRKQKTA